MKKTIIVPTDFTVESLQPLRSILASADVDVRFEIILLHGLSTSDSITDMLFYSPVRELKKLNTTEFDKACELIRNKYESRITSLRKELFHGFTQSAFEGFLKSMRADEAVMSTKYSFKAPTDKSFDISKFLMKSSLRVNMIEERKLGRIPEKGTAAEVFHNSMAMG